MLDATYIDALVQAIAQAIGRQLTEQTGAGSRGPSVSSVSVAVPSTAASAAASATSSAAASATASAAASATSTTMSSAPAIRRLGEGGLVGSLATAISSMAVAAPVPVTSSATPPAAPSAAMSAAPSSAPPAATPAVAASSQPAARRLDQRLITLATLQGQLSGIRQLIVPAKAVVTPTAIDWLRKHQIELQRDADGGDTAASAVPLAAISRSATASYSSSSSGAVARKSFASTVTAAGKVAAGRGLMAGGASSQTIGTLYVHGDDPALARRNWQSIWPQDTWTVESLVSCPLPQAIAELAAVLAGSGRLGVLLSSEPDAALWLANRQGSLRGTMASTVEGVQAAVQSIGANLLIIAPQRTAAYQSRGIVRQFLAGGPRGCPARWAAVEQQAAAAGSRGGV